MREAKRIDGMSKSDALSVYRFLVKENLRYYKRMAELYPDEDVWKLAINDCESFLRENPK